MRWLDTLHRKLLRDLWRARGQFAAVATIILCAVAIHISMDSAMRNLVLTRDAYLEDYRFADLFFHVERAPSNVLHKIRKIPGVADVEGRIVEEVTLDVPGNPDPVAGRVVSVPWPERSVLNGLHIVTGRYPGGPSAAEVLVDPDFAEANGLSVGSELEAAVGDRKVSLRVCGTALCPEFVYVIRDASSFLPDPKAFGILWAPREFAETLFGFRQAVNDVVVSLDGGSPEQDVKEAVEDVLDPFGLTLKIGRKDHISFQFLDNEIKQLRDSAGVVPRVFLFVAAVSIFIVLQRIVRAQRTQIGVLKASGFSNGQILVHYVEFALVAALLGAVPGLWAGDVLAAAIVEMYAGYFNFPILVHRVYPESSLAALALTFGFCSAAGALVAWRILRIRPAEAMRPPAPARVGAIVLERVGWLWTRLPFAWRTVLRNVFRHKGRSAFTLFVTALSCTILLMAFAMDDAIDFLLSCYVADTQRQDAKVALYVPRAMPSMADLEGIEGVEVAEPLLQVPFDLRSGWRTKTALVTGMRRDGSLLRLVDRDRGAVALPRKGLLLNRALADTLGVDRGDVVEAKALFPGFDERPLLVGGVFEEALGLNGYMEIGELATVLKEPPAFNAALLKVRPDAGSAVKSRLKDLGAVSSVTLSAQLLENFEEAIGQTMSIAVGIYIFFAGLISFAILFNSVSIALAERARELASLRVLGFTTGEVALFLFGEFYLLVAIGLAPGLWLGTWLAGQVMDLYGTDTVRFPASVDARSYVVTALLVLGFTVLASLAGGRKLRKLDMVEALKVGE